MSTKKINRRQHAAIQALLTKMGIEDQKETLVHIYTNGRSKSRADLTSDEANELIAYLKKLDPEEKAAEVMRKKIIALAHEMGWRIPGTTRADMRRIDNWCAKFGYLKKKLNQHLYKELPRLVTQFEAAHTHFLKGI